MADTKLSNINGFERLYRSVPSKIEAYTKESHEDIDEIRQKNRYVSEVSPLGMIICIAIMLLGVLVIVESNRIFLFIKEFMIPIGIFMIVVAVHGICRMLYAMQLNGCDKKLNKAEDSFKIQYASESPSAEELMRAVAAGEEREIAEQTDFSRKLESAYEKAEKYDKYTSLLILISRIAIPVLLFGTALYTLRWGGAFIPFVVMFIFCRRLCLLLEYKANRWVRALMCLPLLLYGWRVYACLSVHYAEQYMIAEELLEKLPESLQGAFLMAPVLAVLQTICLILAVCSMNYYGEREYLSKGLKRSGKKIVKKWGIYLRITGYIVLMIAYAAAIMKFWPKTQGSTFSMVLWCVGFGAVWRVISPIWPPSTMEKVTRKYWTTGYSLVVELFFVISLFTLVFCGNLHFVIQLTTIVAIGIIVLASWIVFAVMQHFAEG